MGQFPTPADSILSGLWDEVGDVTLSAAADVITISGIATTYTMFRFAFAVVEDNVGALSLRLRLNNDGGGNYHLQQLTGDGTTETEAEASGGTGTYQKAVVQDEAAFARGLVAKSLAGVRGNAVSMLQFDVATAIKSLTEATEWNNVAALISRLDVVNGGAGDLGAGSRLIVEGFKI